MTNAELKEIYSEIHSKIKDIQCNEYMPEYGDVCAILYHNGNNVLKIMKDSFMYGFSKGLNARNIK